MAAPHVAPDAEWLRAQTAGARGAAFSIDSAVECCPALVCGCDLSFSAVDLSVCAGCIVQYDMGAGHVVGVARGIFRTDVRFTPGFLAFREVPALLHLIQSWDSACTPEHRIAAVLVDGNGILHDRRFGSASHLGACLHGTRAEPVPTVGCAKTFYQTDGLCSTAVKGTCGALLRRRGDGLLLRSGVDGAVLAWALRTAADGKQGRGGASGLRIAGTLSGCAATAAEPCCAPEPAVVDAPDCAATAPCKPVFVSSGYGITAEAAAALVLRCCMYRVPEPIRLADKISRADIAAWDAAQAARAGRACSPTDAGPNLKGRACSPHGVSGVCISLLPADTGAGGGSALPALPSLDEAQPISIPDSAVHDIMRCCYPAASCAAARVPPLPTSST